jgi:hypothetical protein
VDHHDGGNRSRKQSSEAYVADPPRPSTFLEVDFNMVMDDQCQFHHDAKHTTRECEQLKRALRVPSESKKAKSDKNNDQNGNRRNRRPDRRDYRDRRPYHRNDDMDQHYITVSTNVMTDAVTTVATIVTKTNTTIGGVIVVMTSAMATAMIGVMINVVKTITIATTTTQGAFSTTATKRG